MKKLHLVSRNWSKENRFCSFWVQLYQNPLFYQQIKWSLCFLTSFIAYYVTVVSMQSILLYRHGFRDVSVTLSGVSVILLKYTLNVHPRSDSTELAEAVPIDLTAVKLKQERYRLHTCDQNLRNCSDESMMSKYHGRIYYYQAVYIRSNCLFLLCHESSRALS